MTHSVIPPVSSPRYLTKTRFKLAVECPTKLFYTGKPDRYRDTRQDNSFLQMLAEGGYQVGELAKCQYPQGIEVTETAHQAALDKTAQLLQADRVVVFEAAVAYQNFFIRIDILVKDGDRYELIEVKAKSYDSTRPDIAGTRGSIKAPMRPYIEDVAFQAWVLQQAIPHAKIRTFLMMPDKSVKAKHDRMNQWFLVNRDGLRVSIVQTPEAGNLGLNAGLLAKVPVDEYVKIIEREGVGDASGRIPLDQAARQWAQAYALDQKIAPSPGAKCSRCELQTSEGDALQSGLHACWAQAFEMSPADMAQGTVLDLWNFRKKDALIAQGRVRLSSVQPDDIGVKDGGETLSVTERQWMQANGIPPEEDLGGYWLAVAHLRREMADWRYPLHFIDFETSAVAIPFHRGMRPYEQVAFQFSHHVMHKDGRVEHRGQFLLAEPGVFPNFEFARALRNELFGDDGTVLMWSHHEHTILNRIAAQIDESNEPPQDAQALRAFVLSLTRTGDRPMYDLCALAKAAFFHVATKGSVSIKKVLPAMLSTSDWLRQHYAQPIYGAADGMTSSNFKDTVWCPKDMSGASACDPYALLRDFGTDLMGDAVLPGPDPDEMVIAEGGAAAMAYARLQFETLQPQVRLQIQQALLRYCELDTLAMVMVVQGWQRVVFDENQ